MSTFAEVARVRRQQVVNLSITELMILLVFMAITYSFLAREEDRREIPFADMERQELIDEIKRLKTQLERLQRERDVAQARVAELERQLRQLFPEANPPVANPGSESYVAIAKSALAALRAQIEQLRVFEAQISKLEDQLAEIRQRATKAEQQVQELNATIAELRKRLNGGKAPGLPRCPLVTGFLLSVTAKADGTYTGASAWDKSANTQISALPGVLALSSGQGISESGFRKSAAELNKWADLQAQPCRFSVRVKRDPNNQSFEVWERQLVVIEQFFYVRRDR